MGAMRQIGAALMMLLLVPCINRATAGGASSDSLFSQSTLETLNRDFAQSDISFLLLDARTSQTIASRWEQADLPIPMGSLDKPFAALAYAEHHGDRFPSHTCRGTADGCWRPRGHGTLDLPSAVAYSCNAYFRTLAADLNGNEVSATATRFGLEPPASGTSGASLAGLGGDWRTSPKHMASAYLELLRHRDEPAVAQILDGMAMSARFGTAAEIDRALPFRAALAKTGTAPCTHDHRAPGDGFTVAMFPADAPRVLLLVRVHGVPGAVAAKTAGQMLSRIER